jgi:hypothetical protein
VTAFLLDVDVLIALIDRAHVHHDAAHAWFAGLFWMPCRVARGICT